MPGFGKMALWRLPAAPSPAQGLGFLSSEALGATFLATRHPVGLAFLPRAQARSQQELPGAVQGLETGRAAALQRRGRPDSSGRRRMQGAAQAVPRASPQSQGQGSVGGCHLSPVSDSWLKSPRRRAPPGTPQPGEWERGPVQEVLPVSPGTRDSGRVGAGAESVLLQLRPGDGAGARGLGRRGSRVLGRPLPRPGPRRRPGPPERLGFSAAGTSSPPALTCEVAQSSPAQLPPPLLPPDPALRPLPPGIGRRPPNQEAGRTARISGRRAGSGRRGAAPAQCVPASRRRVLSGVRGPGGRRGNGARERARAGCPRSGSRPWVSEGRLAGASPGGGVGTRPGGAERGFGVASRPATPHCPRFS